MNDMIHSNHIANQGLAISIYVAQNLKEKMNL